MRATTMPVTRVKDAGRLAKSANRSREDRGIARAVAAAKRNPLSPEELISEDRWLAAYGSRQANKLGIQEHDAVRIVHESRRRRSAC